MNIDDFLQFQCNDFHRKVRSLCGTTNGRLRQDRIGDMRITEESLKDTTRLAVVSRCLTQVINDDVSCIHQEKNNSYRFDYQTRLIHLNESTVDERVCNLLTGLSVTTLGKEDYS